MSHMSTRRRAWGTSAERSETRPAIHGTLWGKKRIKKCQKKKNKNKKQPSSAPKLVPGESLFRGITLCCITKGAALAAAQAEGNPSRFNATATCNDTHSSSQRQVAGPSALIHMNIMPTAMQGINIFRANSLTFIAPLFLIVLICVFSIPLLLFFYSQTRQKVCSS